MSRTLRSKGAVSRDNSEDGSSQSRIQLRSSKRIRTQQLNNFANSPVSAQSQPAKRLKTSQTKYVLSSKTSSSESEDGGEEYPPHSRNRITIPFNYHKPVESSGRTGRSTRASMVKRNDQKCSIQDLEPQQYTDSDSSTDESVVSPRLVKGFKRPLSPSSFSDSSDSGGAPTGSKRCIKHMKLCSSSDSNSSESSCGTSDHNQEHYVTSVPLDSTSIPRSVNSDESHLASISRCENDDEGPDIVPFTSVRIFGPRRQVIESENESDLLPSSHIVRGRRISVIESEDDSGSLVEYNGRNSRISSVQGNIAQRANSASHVSENQESVRTSARFSRRNALPLQENNSISEINSSGSVSSNFRQLSRVEVGSDGQNIWRVTTQAGESEDDIPVLSTRRVRGRRMPVVESEDEGSPSINSGNNRELSTQGIEDLSNDESNTISNYNGNIPIKNEDESDTSDSEIRPIPLSNRMAPIFQSDDSSSSSSNSSLESDDSIPIRNFRRRNRPIPITDYHYEDIANGIGEFEVNIKASTVINILGNHETHCENSSDADGELEKCPICLVGFKLQEIGKPTSCDHKFCSLCLKEWAAKNNTCPVDRKVFNGIIIYDKIEGKIICELPVEKAEPQDNEIDFIAEFLTDSSDDLSWYLDSDGDGPEEICSVCGRSYQPHRMISCDSCNSVYHLACLDPPLRDFPTSNWYCSDCDYSTEFSSDSN